jgi:thiol-disulfide isomerase/thioredoxin
MSFPRNLLAGACAALLVAAAVIVVRADGVHAKAPEPIRIARGESVALADYVVPGKTTIFDFYSDYCPPCRALRPKLENLHRTNPGVALVVVDINRPGVKGIDWKSPVARQYQLESIPHLAVYGPDGRLQADGDGAEAIVARLLTP